MLPALSGRFVRSLVKTQCRSYHLPEIKRVRLPWGHPFSAPAVPQLQGGKSDAEATLEEMKPGDFERLLNVKFGPNMPTIHDEQSPERDVKNFPRFPVLLQQPPTRFHIIPESWFQFFREKTGVTGPYVFTFSFGTFLFSKEWLIVEHELVTGLSSTIVLTWLCIKFGPMLRKYLTGQIDESIKQWDNWQDGHIKFLGDLQKAYKEEQGRVQHIPLIYETRKEDVAVQCEAEYRRRLKHVYDDVRRRLNYLVAVGDTQRNVAHQNMVEWVIDNSVSSIGAQQEKEVLDNCVVNLRQMAESGARINTL